MSPPETANDYYALGTRIAPQSDNDNDEPQQHQQHNNNDSDTMMKLASLAPHHHHDRFDPQQQEEKAPFDEEENKDDAEAIEWTLTAADLKQKPMHKDDTKQQTATTTIIGTIELAHKESVVKETIAGNAKIVNQRSVLDDDSSEDDDDDDDEELLGLDHTTDESYGLIPGVLPHNGMAYTPTQIIVQGWLYKKGTGQDWFKSRAWKARWARLVWAKLDDTAIEVPMLLMYWYPSSQKASTAVVLSKSTVVVAVDFKPNPTAWNAHRLEIRHLQTSMDELDKKELATRTLAAANRQERNAWIYAMAQALLDYSKAKQVHDRALRSVSPPPRRNEAIRPVSPRPRSPVPLDLPKSPRSSVPRKIVVKY